MPGIYRITNVVDGQETTYVGSTSTTFKMRWREHRKFLRRGCHHNRHLQAAWDVYGEEAFAFTILEIVKELDNLYGREQEWLDTYRALGPVYNFGPVARNAMLGRRHTQESRRRMSRAQRGRRHSDETKRRISQSQKGRIQSVSTREKISKARAKPYPAFQNVETGEIVPSGHNLAKLCRERDWCITSMWELAIGRYKKVHAWRLAKPQGVAVNN